MDHSTSKHKALLGPHPFALVFQKYIRHIKYNLIFSGFKYFLSGQCVQ